MHKPWGSQIIAAMPGAALYPTYAALVLVERLLLGWVGTHAVAV